ncbi:hypothetical protein N6H14_29805 [Paenibacillus sp. CC-CFT747]|nr:hypothetical protein N6H14_29805 [Paenibacillus sp. CC-CFT747]
MTVSLLFLRPLHNQYPISSRKKQEKGPGLSNPAKKSILVKETAAGLKRFVVHEKPGCGNFRRR